jgi:hypothetical protein
MCQPECVATVKELMAELCVEKNGLVERLNAIQERIEGEEHLLTKVHLKVEWMEEKRRSVEPLRKVPPLLNSLPPASNRDHPDGHQLTRGSFPRRSWRLFKACSRRTT